MDQVRKCVSWKSDQKAITGRSLQITSDCVAETEDMVCENGIL